MTPERWTRVERLYHAALELAEHERSAFLDESCAGDEALRREVESLLSFDGPAEEFLRESALDAAASHWRTASRTRQPRVPAATWPAPRFRITTFAASWAAAVWVWSMRRKTPNCAAPSR